jgi:hypothetical protein
MVLKIRSLAFMLLLLILFSGVVYSEDAAQLYSTRNVVSDIVAAFERANTEPPGMTGTIIDTPDNPKVANGYTWWKVSYDDGTAGWSAEKGLDHLSDNSEPSSTTESSSTKFNKGDKVKVAGEATDKEDYLNVRSDAGTKYQIKHPEEYASYQAMADDTGIGTYGKYQFTVASGNLQKVLGLYTRNSQTDTSGKLKDYLNNINQGKLTLESLRTDVTFESLLIQAASEEAMKDAQEEVFTENFYNEVKSDADTDKVTSALAIAILCDTKINGHYQTALEETEKYFIDKQYTEKEWLNYFLDRRQALLGEGSPNLDRVSALRNLVDDNNLDLNQGDSNHQIDLGKYGKVDTIDSPSRHLAALDMLGLGSPLLPAPDSGSMGSNSGSNHITSTSPASVHETEPQASAVLSKSASQGLQPNTQGTTQYPGQLTSTKPSVGPVNEEIVNFGLNP